MPEPSLTDKQVYIPVTFCGGFHVSSETFAKAQKAANDTRLLHFIGNLPSGQEVSGCSREALLEQGCVSVAWIAPERI